MNIRTQRFRATLGLVLALLTLTVCAGCPRNQTTLDDRPLEKRPHVETDHAQDRGDVFRP